MKLWVGCFITWNLTRLRIIPPTGDRKQIFEEAHAGTFGGHLREAKIHGQLSKHYWWPRMRADTTSWCWACLTCATCHVGQAVKPPLTPIPVASPFDRVGVDMIRFPMSSAGNQYAVVFMDYLTNGRRFLPLLINLHSQLFVCWWSRSLVGTVCPQSYYLTEERHFCQNCCTKCMTSWV